MLHKGPRSQSAGSIDLTRQPQHAQAGAQPVAAPAYPQAPPQGAAQQHNPNQALPHSNAGAHLTYAANHGPYQGQPPMTGAGTAGATTAINAYTPQLYAQNPAIQQQQNAQPAMPPPSRAPQAHQPMPANAIIVSKRQQGNPVLKHIRNVRWQFGDIVPDYQLGASAAGLFLSLR